VEFLILGPLEVRERGRPISLGGGKQRALLALLILNANEAVSTERLVDELWGEHPPATAAKIVQNYVSRLRSSLATDEVLTTHGSGYVLRVLPGATDVDRFEELLATGRQMLAAGEAGKASEALHGALSVWRGSPLSDFALEEFAQTEIARLEERRLVALEERIAADLALGRHHDLVGELEALIAQHPLRERLRAQLMLALYRSGRQSEALHAYGEARRMLAEELGLEPGQPLKQLEKAILEQDPALELGEHPQRRRPARVVRRTRTPALLAGVAVLIAAVSGVLAFAFTRGTEAAGLDSVAANAVGVIDPKTDELVDEVAVGKTPTSIATGEGAVWVLNADDQTISRIDPATRQVENFGIGTTPTDLAVGEGALWVGNGRKPSGVVGHPVATSVSKVDPALTASRQTIRLPEPRGSLSNILDDHIAVGARAVWVINPDASLSRLDPRTGDVTRIEGVAAAAVAANQNSVWLLNLDGTIARVDPRTNSVSRRITVAATALSDIALGDGSVWLAAPYDRVVWRVDPGARLRMKTITVGLGVDRVAFGRGSLWTANSLRGTVSRVDSDADQVVRTISVGNTPRSLAVGAGAVWVSVAGAGGGRVPAAAPSREIEGVSALPRSICGNVFYGGEGAPDYLIVSDLPLQGGTAFPTLQMSEAIGFVLRKHAFRAGQYRVAYQSCDDSTAQTGIFDRDKCASNAKAYGDNRDVIGVIGPFNSDCAFSLIPVANRAPEGPLPIVSPTSSIVGLTRPAPRAPRGALEGLYPTGRRNYVRVFPTEDSQSAANALFARRLGLRRIFVLHDGDESFGLAKAIYFRRAARRLGLRIVGFRAWDPRAVGYAPLAEDVARARPDGVFLGGGTYSNGGLVLRDLRDEVDPGVRIFAAEFVPISDLFDRAGPAARGAYVSLPGLTIDRLPPAGRRFVREFAAIQPGGRVEVSSVYAAQATELLLAAIARSDGSRASVTKELLAARVKGGILGDFRISPTGDTTAQPITMLRAVRGGAPERIQGDEGGEIVRVIAPPPSLTR
jgi:DNA-binding SARP family transcriptional activator/ABC-type branched-subunit amino acid transport system substrate-binding protein/DNA-binding beta-propeller fold protein YncE